MIRLVVLAALSLALCGTVGAAAEQTPARWAGSKNARMFFDDDPLKAATDEIGAAYRYEVEAFARVLADCDISQLVSGTSETCTRSFNYFLVVTPKSDGAVPRLLLAMGSAAREMRLQDNAQQDADQKRAFARWVKVQAALGNAARSRLLALAKDGH
jgi:hypothetical protein